MPKGIGKLTKLEMLSDFIVGEKGKDDAAGLDELSTLEGLRNDLSLSHLERLGKGTNGSFPIKSLKLRSLQLDWDGELRRKEEAILDRLQPHSDLKGLIIRGYMGCTFSSWVFQLHELVVLEIWYCKYCKQLPPIHQLPYLKSLKLISLSELEYIEEGQRSSAFFPSLQEIVMSDLPNFKGWVNLQGNNSQGKEIPDEDDDLLLPVFPTVTREADIWKSYISECQRFSYVREDGHLSLMNVEEYIHKWLRNNSTFQEVPLNNEVKATPSLRFLSSVPITELKSLEIGGFKGTTWRAIIQCLPVLERLKICNCLDIDLSSVLVIERVARMATIPWWFRHLSGLKILRIHNCDGLECLWRDRELDLNVELDGSNNNMDISDTLRELTIQGSKLEFLPWWIGHLKNIEKLSIYNWENLKALPECLCHLTSLQELQLGGCKALESMSRKVIIHLISTLREWSIFGCEKLDLNGELDEKDDAASTSQLRMVPNIRHLRIDKNKVEFFPWWIEHLKNLERLSIFQCDNLKALPEWLCKLTSLTWLNVSGCPSQIGKRCKRNGEDGPKISHIDLVWVDVSAN
ncbi:hypothetical protein SAY87_006377 [Trapa incisa]|uniref:Uncharacterized protein n=1 Tax=Trapa incisa TaxID=236973 RepID=A0AAN7K263_9MYRT|nr:hypothetical protein SAY87_006377 [Trapa incisa]